MAKLNDVVIARMVDSVGDKVVNLVESFMGFRLNMLQGLGPDRYMEWEKMQHDNYESAVKNMMEAAMKIAGEYMNPEEMETVDEEMPGVDVDGFEEEEESVEKDIG